MSFVIENVIPGDRRIEFVSTQGHHVVVTLYGDCCSRSYFDPDSSIDARGLMGEELLDIESNEVRVEDDIEDDIEDTVQRIHYALIIRTNKQSVSLMWRNDSNGYYSGWTKIRVNDSELRRWGGDSLSSRLEVLT